MAEYKGAIVRNGLIAVVLSIVIVGSVFYGSQLQIASNQVQGNNSSSSLSSIFSQTSTSSISSSKTSAISTTSEPSNYYGRVTSTLSLEIHPSWISYNQKNNLLYTTGDNQLVIINPSKNNTIVKVIPMGRFSGQPIVDGSNGLVYIPTNSSITVLNGTEVVATITNGYAGTTGWGTFDSENQNIYIATSRMQPSYIAIQILSTKSNTIITNITSPTQLGLSIMQLLYDSQNKLLYVVSYGSYGIAMINTTTNQFVGSVQIGSIEHGVANAIAWDPVNNLMYVPDWGDNQTVIFSAKNDSVITSVSSSWPDNAIFDSQNGLVYIANSKSNSLQVLDGTKLVSSIPTQGASPWGTAFDSNNSDIYVTNVGSSSISVIST